MWSHLQDTVHELVGGACGMHEPPKPCANEKLGDMANMQPGGFHNFCGSWWQREGRREVSDHGLDEIPRGVAPDTKLENSMFLGFLQQAGP